jgi:hypothetical protein
LPTTVIDGYFAVIAARNFSNRSKYASGRFSSLPTARWVSPNGRGCPISARTAPQVDVFGPVANSIRSRVSWMCRRSSASSSVARFCPHPVTRAGTTGRAIAPMSSANWKYS